MSAVIAIILACFKLLSALLLFLKLYSSSPFYLSVHLYFDVLSAIGLYFGEYLVMKLASFFSMHRHDLENFQDVGSDLVGTLSNFF